MNADSAPRLKIHAVINESTANGPGNRTVIWVQGCSLGCADCFNPQTHPFHLGTWVNSDDLAEQVLIHQSSIEGITLSGGEPLFQIDALEYLLSSIRKKSDLSVILLTGFEWNEIMQLKGDRLFPYLDVIIYGRFKKNLRVGNSFVGSANKQFYFLTPRYTLEDFKQVPVCEITIDEDGNTLISGIDPVVW